MDTAVDDLGHLEVHGWGLGVYKCVSRVAVIMNHIGGLTAHEPPSRTEAPARILGCLGYLGVVIGLKVLRVVRVWSLVNSGPFHCLLGFALPRDFRCRVAGFGVCFCFCG